MSEAVKKFTPSQQNVIDFSGNRLLVSASAGTGKTTVMIERIVSLIERNADISEFVVVTFTNLAAAEMKARLATKLAENRNNPRVIEQLEKLDSASICTLHSFCNDLLRNYFYVVDIDPAFTILDSATSSTLKRGVIDDLLLQYFSKKDDEFRRVYKIFSTSRKEENFVNTLIKLHTFSRNFVDFEEWYRQSRQNFLEYSEDNPIVKILRNDIQQNIAYYARSLQQLATRSDEANLPYTALFNHNAELLEKLRTDTLPHALADVWKHSFERLPNKKAGIDFPEIEERIRNDFKKICEDCNKFIKKYVTLFRGESFDVIWGETQKTVEITDKLVELVLKLEEGYFKAKKQRGGLDFNDLEHLCLKLLKDENALKEIRARYKYVFVDEYQDTNPVQEAIVATLSKESNLFMVGDVKQSIYGFRGCDPSIFVDKYSRYKATGEGHVEELNDNFRSNSEILQFVNSLFNCVMTDEFGQVNYRRDAQLQGSAQPTLQTPSVCVDFVVAPKADKRAIDIVYDITANTEELDSVNQATLIAQRIKQYVGMEYVNGKGETATIGYGDIVILMRSMKDKAMDIYNTLIANNIPVSAGFKIDGMDSREVKDLINLLRVIDNPYNDIYTVGVCLSPFGKLTENELVPIRLDTADYTPFYDRLKWYAENGQEETIAKKVRNLLEFLRSIRLYSRSATVSEIALRVLKLTNYQLYVEGLPNGALRSAKLYAFIDKVKGATYAQSVDKFLNFIDDSEDNKTDEALTGSNTVRLMTMHASKGLEFPIVFLAGLEKGINFDNQETFRKSTSIGLSLPYYNFANMRVASTLGATACKMFNYNKQREEEMRLLYVAMTRAKFVLHLVAETNTATLEKLPPAPSEASSHLDWLLTALSARKQFDSDFVVVNVVTDVKVSQEQDQAEDYLCKQSENMAEVELSIGYKYPYAAETDMPSKLVSSALDKEYIDGEESERYEHVLNVNNDRNFIGTAYHKVYQYVDYKADEEQIRSTIEALVADEKIERSFADELDVSLIYRTLNNPQLVEVIERGKVYHEMPFMLYAPYSKLAKDKRYNDDVMLQGVIDLLVIEKDKVTVIDFKYVSRSDLVEQRYTAQLNSYRLAVQRICGIDDVRCFVLSIADNKLIPM